MKNLVETSVTWDYIKSQRQLRHPKSTDKPVTSYLLSTLTKTGEPWQLSFKGKFSYTQY